MSHLIRIGPLVIAALLGASTAVAQGPADTAIVSWARRRVLPVGLEGDQPVPGIAPLVARSRLIGIGESVHNQQEFLALRFRLLRDLVIHHRVRALVIESGLPEGRDLDRYVTGLTDTVNYDAVLKYGFGSFTEVRAAMTWLRRWNEGPGKQRPVRVFGIDLAASAGSMVPALDRLVESAGDDPGLVAWINSGVRPLAGRVSGAFWRPAAFRYDSLTPAAKDSLQAAVTELVARVRGRSDWETRLALVAQQTETMLRLGAYHPDNPRDVAMAANTEWVLRQQQAGDRVILWAHNAHVQKVPIEGPPQLHGGTTPSMGTILSTTLGDGYVAIGTSYGGASADSAAAPVPGSVDQFLGTLGRPAPFLLELQRHPATGPARLWLDTPRPMRFEVGHLTVALGRAFDGVIFFDHARPADRTDQPGN